MSGRLDFKAVATIIGDLQSLRFFPVDESGRLAVVKIAGKMASNIEQVRWLVDRMLVLYNDWPGPKEMRAVFCSRFKPADGIVTYSEVFHGQDGIPAATGSLALNAGHPVQKALPPGHVVTADKEFDDAIKDLARRKRMP